MIQNNASTETERPRRGRPPGKVNGDDLTARSVRFKTSTWVEIERAYTEINNLPNSAKITKQSFLEILLRRGLENVLKEIFDEKSETKQGALFPLKKG